ncbi:MAG: 2-hydroxyglutaryl-CoA dehydratase [Syntrophus sp. (in: bacteria)]|nr:2-hydroxyglutaryl-CoA dehydratase [Syntrophus sp. (in: bacteria)]
MDIYFAGIDLGSTMTKVVIVDQEGKTRAALIGPTGAEHRRLANKVMVDALARAELAFDDLSYVVATGYGRINVPFADRQITELTCHAKGIASLFPGVRTAIDIGGQDAKGLKIRNDKLVDFVMNDRCAAGTGRFLDVLVGTLGLRIEELGEISLKATQKLPISSICTVFAQMEIMGWLSQGTPLPDIVAGLHDAIANRVVKMAKKLKIEPEVVFTGGVAKNIGVVNALQEQLGLKVSVPPEPLLTGALGAALLGREMALKALAEGKPIHEKELRLTEATFFKTEQGG